jgi:hypothetical protein
MVDLHKFQKVFRALDFIGTHVKITLQADEKIKTGVGATFSLLAVAGFVSVTYYLVQSALDKSHPYIQYHKSMLHEYPQLDMLESKQIPIILFFNSSFPISPAKTQQYLHFRMSLVKQTIGGGDIGFEHTNIPIVPCSNLSLSQLEKILLPGITPMQNALIMNYGWCPSLTSQQIVKVEGRITQNVRHYLEGRVLPCSMDRLGSNTQCLPWATLHMPQIILTQTTAGLDLKNNTSPVRLSLDEETGYPLSQSTVLQVIAKMKTVEVRNDEWGIYPERLVSSSPQIDSVRVKSWTRGTNFSATDCSEEDPINNLAQCVPMLIFQYTSGNLVEIYSRSYKQIFELLASIGGIRDIIFALAFYLFSWLGEKSMKRRLADHVFHLNSKHLEGSIPDSKKNPEVPSPQKVYQFVQNNLEVKYLVSRLTFVDCLMKFMKNQYTSFDEANDMASSSKPPKFVVSSNGTDANQTPKFHELYDNDHPVDSTGTNDNQDRTIGSGESERKLFMRFSSFRTIEAPEAEMRKLPLPALKSPKSSRFAKMNKVRDEAEQSTPVSQKPILNLPISDDLQGTTSVGREFQREFLAFLRKETQKTVDCGEWLVLHSLLNMPSAVWKSQTTTLDLNTPQASASGSHSSSFKRIAPTNFSELLDQSSNRVLKVPVKHNGVHLATSSLLRRSLTYSRYSKSPLVKVPGVAS